EKAGAVPVKAGVLYRFAIEMAIGDVVIYPSKFDKTVNIGWSRGTTLSSPPQTPCTRIDAPSSGRFMRLARSSPNLPSTRLVQQSHCFRLALMRRNFWLR